MPIGKDVESGTDVSFKARLQNGSDLPDFVELRGREFKFDPSFDDIDIYGIEVYLFDDKGPLPIMQSRSYYFTLTVYGERPTSVEPEPPIS